MSEVTSVVSNVALLHSGGLSEGSAFQHISGSYLQEKSQFFTGVQELAFVNACLITSLPCQFCDSKKHQFDLLHKLLVRTEPDSFVKVAE